MGIPILFSAFSRTVTVSPVTPVALTLDEPITTALSTSVHGAYHTARVVEGYTGNTCRLLRRSDNAEEDFGVNSLGSLDMDAVNAWRGVADVDVVKLYDQIGSNDLTAVGRARLIDGGNVVRFGVSRSSSDETLTRSTTDGGVGIDTGSDLSYFISDSTYTLTSSEGIELHYAFSFKQDIDSSYSSEQYPITFGKSDNIYFNHGVGPANTVDYIRCKTTSGNSVEGQSVPYKANGLHVQSTVMDGTDFTLHAHGQLDTQAIESGTVTDIGSNIFSGSKLVVGAKFTGSSGAIRSDRRANMVFGGVIITKSISDKNRWLIRQKLQAIAYEHRIVSVETLKGYFAGGVLAKDVSSHTIAPFTGTGTFNFNNTTGSPDFVYGHTLDGFGLEGIRSIADNNDNAFVSDDAVPPDLNGTVLSFHYSETSGNNVCNVLSIASDTQGEFDDTLDDVSFSIGYDHGEPSTMNMIADSRDDDGLIGRRVKADETAFNYDMSNQSQAKYNRNTAHDDFVYNETYDSHVWDIDDWQNNGDQPYDLDGPVVSHLAGNTKSLSKDGALNLHIGTFEAPSGYNKADPWSTRKSYRLQSDNYSYVSQGALPAHRWGDIAYNPYGSVVDNASDAKFMSRHGLQQSFRGTIIAFAWSPDVFDMEKIEEVSVNWYKLFE